MKMKLAFVTLLLVITFSFSGCFGIYLDIDEGVPFPAAKFTAAWDRINWLAKHDPQRAGEVSKLCVLVYSGRKREFVSAGVPISLVREMDRGDHFDADAAGAHISRYVELEKLDLQDLLRFGPGLVAQVDDEEEDAHILIWLE